MEDGAGAQNIKFSKPVIGANHSSTFVFVSADLPLLFLMELLTLLTAQITVTEHNATYSNIMRLESLPSRCSKWFLFSAANCFKVPTAFAHQQLPSVK